MSTNDSSVHLARQPILDRKDHVIGYELLYRDSALAQTAEFTDRMRASMRVMMNTLSEITPQALIGDKLAFINVDDRLLFSEYLELLPPQHFVLELLDNHVISSSKIERIEALRKQGFAIALDDLPVDPTDTALIKLADYVKLDILSFDKSWSETTLRHINKVRKLKLVAKRVETQAQAKQCRELNFNYFQGYYFAKPQNLSSQLPAATYAHVVDLMNKVSHTASMAELELAFRRDVGLSTRFLRYMNSAAFADRAPIRSISHAVAMLGYRQLYRWLTLLLVHTGATAAKSPALAKAAVARGRLTELLTEGRFHGDDKDNAFLAGVLSMVNALVDAPADVVLPQLRLPEDIVQAALNRSGRFGPYVALAECCENDDQNKLSTLADELKLTAEQINFAQFQALHWTELLGI
jgi:EAL and modified HD-GYP domain-containing signal transduction protein